ncbi:secretin and TonB N-terminal domain-containing protein [Variovorax sp. PAMC26660]|uniref:secretin and TonB N-terminal domain-containing protein n=1 Tax=Variovorax sp. PAMC26660 TaxID=2762322 RepID=UPI00164E7C0B|nr:secretin and TonB N-terminal domain-containing protein [Variovorax sp. PAMC26660]QNK66560.1 TonB-dependent outer membrane receptor [Variovorax sp. PAMC26660]
MGASFATVADRVSFDIPAQPLASALQAFAQASGQSVFFDGQLAAGLESMPVRGELAPRDALHRMLAGTRLVARYADDTTFTLVETEAAVQAPVAASAAPSVEATGDGNARIVQQALERTLCRWPRVQPGDYRALVQLWVGPAGHVRRTRLLSSTGVAQRDAALEAAMNTLVLSPPKDGTPDEPLTILLLPRTGRSTDVCAGLIPAAS